MSSAKLSFGTRTWVAMALAPLLLAVAVAANQTSTPPGGTKNPEAAPAKALSNAFHNAVKEVEPSVVMIKSESALPVKFEGKLPNDEEGSLDKWFGDKQFGGRVPGMPDLGKFFKELPRMPKHGESGMGSGLIIDSSGLILTNRHVVADGNELTVRLHDGREFKATKVAGDSKTDLAVLRIRGADNLTAAKLGDSDAVEVGDWVLALGNPFGLEGTVTAGIVSAKGRGIGIAERESFLQTDAAINPGNSGGPLVNLDGEVIGINTAISSSSGGNEGVGFAIPINLAKWVANQLVKDGTVHRARLGVIVQPLTYDLAKQFGLKAHEGVLVAEIMPESPAAKTGLKSGDVIVEFAGTAVSSPQELQAAVERAQAGQQQDILVLRDGKRETLKVSPNEQPESGKTAGGSREKAPAQSSHLEKLGIEVANLTTEVAKQLGIQAEHGAVVTDVRAGSPADRAGLTTGMVILEVNRKPVKTAEDLSKALDEKSMEKGALLLVRSTQGSRFVVIEG
jgi:serine protease Do